MDKGKKDACGNKLKGLDKGTVCLIIVDGIHLGDKNIGIPRAVFPVVLIGASFQILTVSPFLISCGFLFGDLPGYLSAQIHDRNAGYFVENTVLDIVIESFL